MPRRGTNIYKRKDGRWEARYVVSIGLNGKKKYASVYAATYREVKAKQLEGMSNCRPHPTAGLNSKLEDVMWVWLASTVNTVKPSASDTPWFSSQSTAKPRWCRKIPPRRNPVAEPFRW